MTKTRPTPTGLDIEREHLATIERARVKGVAAAQDGARARAAFELAGKAREAALDSQIRGAGDADAQFDKALAAAHEAAHRISAAEEQGQASLRVRRAAELRLAQTRQTLVDELAPSAEKLVALAIDARDALVEPLARWQRADAAARRRWAELRPGVTAKVEQLDRERGAYRDEALVAREATCPRAPVDTDVIARLLGTTPRPLAMTVGYSPGMAPEQHGTSEESGPKALFPGDEGHQAHTLGVESEPPGWPLNVPEPASPAALTRASLERAVR